MEAFDKSQLRELITKGEKLQAVDLVWKTMSLSLMDAMDYVDTYCRQENIGVNPPNPSYSASTENGFTIYYKTENGVKRIISKEEAPEFLVNKVESAPAGWDDKLPQATVGWDDKQPRQSRNRIHKKGRRMLIYASIAFFVVGIFYMYQIYVSKALAIDSLNIAIACGVIIICLYFFYLLLWLDETIYRRQHNNR